MPDYLNRIIIESLENQDYNIILKSIDDDGRYWISSDGKLISVCRDIARYKHFSYDNDNGYLYTKINNKKIYLHRLLAFSFCCDSNIIKNKKYYEVHHLDRNKKNNNLNNLCIISKEKHNAIHNIWRKLDKWSVIN